VVAGRNIAGVSSTTVPPVVAAWHAIVAGKDVERIPELLADSVVFRSPAVFTPQVGREKATAYLTSAMAVLGPTLRYEREWYAEDSAVLEFGAEVDGLTVHGIDMMRWDAAGKLVEFTVMVRPLRGLQQLVTRMSAQLQQG
jgi:SnoaL-like domain